MAAIPSFSNAHLERIAQVLGDTGSGFTGTQIAQLLRACDIEDVAPSITKWKRLFEALNARQVRDRCGNLVIAFIQNAMAPVRYTGGDRRVFESRRTAINEILLFTGMELGHDGEIRQTTRVRTLSEAEERVGRLRSELIRRRVHGDVLAACRVELLQDNNYFHSVLEAAKSVAEKIRRKTGLTSDGSELVDQAFGLGSSNIPLLALNTLRTETERGEQRGFMNLLKGLFGAFRNPTAHAPKLTWPIGEDDAIDILTLVSLLHRRLDASIATRLVGGP